MARTPLKKKTREQKRFWKRKAKRLKQEQRRLLERATVQQKAEARGLEGNANQTD